MGGEFDAWVRAHQEVLRLSEAQVEQLRAYVVLLEQWSPKLNLTGFDLSRDLSRALSRLILEPIVASRSLPGSVYTLLDVGAGGGSPAVPLSIALPMLTTTMVEANQKKSVFLREVIRSTGLAGASVSTGRIEHLKANRGSFDAVTVRAVRLDAVLSGAIAQLLRPGGTLMQFIAAGDAGRKLKDFSPASIVHLGAGSDAGIAIYSRLL